MSRKFLVTVILILFLLPFVSWYYLQSGLNWRRQAQAMMNGTKPFPVGEWIDDAGLHFQSSSLEDHVSLIVSVNCQNADTLKPMLDSFYNQFRETNKANFMILNSCGEKGRLFADSLRKQWHVFSCNDSTDICDVLFPEWPDGKTTSLVDRKMIIRSYYSTSNRDEKRMLLEHMALLLPREGSSDVELKRGLEK